MRYSCVCNLIDFGYTATLNKTIGKEWFSNFCDLLSKTVDKIDIAISLILFDLHGCTISHF